MNDDAVTYLRELADQIEEEREQVRLLQEENIRLMTFCKTLEARLLKDGDPLSGDDWSLMQEVRMAMGKQERVPE